MSEFILPNVCVVPVAGELSGPTPQPWEQATALAIAKMRHRYTHVCSLWDSEGVEQ